MKKQLFLHQRIEIALWTALVHLIRVFRTLPLWRNRQATHRSHRRLARGVTFVVSILVICGAFLISRPSTTISQASEANQLYLAQSNQENILLITVADLKNRSSQLISIWWILHIPSETDYIFIPIYPTDWQGRPITDQQFAESFRLEQKPLLNKSFRDHLARRNLTWKHSLVVDQAGWNSIQELLLQSSASSVIASSGHLSEAETTIYQKTILNALCHNRGDWLNNTDPIPFLEILHPHLQTDIKNTAFVSGWAYLRHSPDRLACEFIDTQTMGNQASPVASR